MPKPKPMTEGIKASFPNDDDSSSAGRRHHDAGGKSGKSPLHAPMHFSPHKEYTGRPQRGAQEGDKESPENIHIHNNLLVN